MLILDFIVAVQCNAFFLGNQESFKLIVNYHTLSSTTAARGNESKQELTASHTRNPTIPPNLLMHSVWNVNAC